MKKILVTTLTLSLAVASGLDARSMKRTRSMSQPVTKQETSRSINALAGEIQNPNIPAQEKNATVKELLALIEQDPNNAEYALLDVKLKLKNKAIEAKEKSINAMNIGWFDFNNVDLKKAKDELRLLITEKKNIEKEIAAQEKVVGTNNSKALRNGIASVALILGTLGLDHYFNAGQGREYVMTKGREFGTAASGYAGSAYDTVSGAARSSYDTVSGAAASGYNKASGAVRAGYNRVRGIQTPTVITSTPESDL